MGCYSCGGNPNTFCRECVQSKDTWIAPVDTLPDTFMGDFDHLYRTPDGNLYALSPERDRWIQVNGSGGNSTVYKAGNGIEISSSNVITNTQPNVTQNLSLNGRTISITNGNSITLPEDRDTVYNDTELKRRIQAVESKTDNFVTGVTVSRTGNKVKLTYTFVNGAPKEVEFEDKDTITLAYDDSALKARVTTLEGKSDKDSQTLSFNNGTRALSISNGNSVTIPSDKQTITRQGNKLVLSNGGGEIDLPQPNSALAYDDTDLKRRVGALESKPDKNTVYNDTEVKKRLTALEGKRDNDNQTLTLNNRTLSISGGNSITLPEDRDTVYNDADIKRRLTALEGKTDNFVTGVTASRNGNKVKLTYNFVTGQNKEVEFDDKDTIGVAYDDTALRNRIKAIEDKPSGVVHRFYNGDIRGTGNPRDIVVVDKSKFLNPDGIKVGDTVEDFFTNSDLVNRGIWKVINITDNNIQVQGMGAYDINLRKTLKFNNETRVLSISGGNSVTLPTATPYNDADIKRRLGVLEAKTDRDNQTLSITNNRLSISNGNSVDIPQPNLSGYVTVQQYNELKGALENLLQDLKNSGAWQQTGSNIFQGRLDNNRHIATGNINLFGGYTDGSSFIRTNSGLTENDLAGGIY